MSENNSTETVVASRNPERTKRAILDATARCLTEQGTGFSIASVASDAGMSKSGVLHHFPCREDLLMAVAADSIDLFRTEVMSFVDLSENYPGKVLRAYVRALCGGSETAMLAFSHTGVWNQVLHVPGVEELNLEDAQQWQSDFSSDGIHPDVILIVRHATEGVVGAKLYDPVFTDEQMKHARELLLKLTLPENSIVGVLSAVE